MYSRLGSRALEDSTMRVSIPCFLAVALFLAAGSARAQEMFIYPNEGQTNQQMEKDKFDCYGWAKSSTGSR